MEVLDLGFHNSSKVRVRVRVRVRAWQVVGISQVAVVRINKCEVATVRIMHLSML